MRARLFEVLVVALLATAADAQQRVWVVDAASGPGTDFVDLGPAIAAAAVDDVIIVRAGNYTGVTIAKPLAILAENGAAITRHGPSHAALGISSIPRGSTLVVRNLRVDVTVPLIGGVSVSGCEGTVLLEDVSHHLEASVQACRDVRLAGCAFASMGVFSSTVAADRTDILHTLPRLDSAPAVRATNSVVQLSRCTLRGADGFFGSSPSPALGLDGSIAVITDDGSASLSSGDGSFSVSAVVGNGALVLDPRVVLDSRGNAMPVAATVSVTRASIPLLAARLGPLGGSIRIELAATAHSPYVLAVGRTAAPVALPGLFGALWFDGGIVLGAGATDATGSAVWNVTIPATPLLLGRSFTWQALTGGTQLALSNPASYVHHR